MIELLQSVAYGVVFLQEISLLEEELARVEEERNDFEEKALAESQSQGRSFELEESQVREYNKLKDSVAKQAAKYSSELEQLTREQRTDQDRLDAEKRKHEEVQNKLNQKQTELSENERRLERLQQYIQTAEAQVKEQTDQLKQLEQEVSSARFD